MAAVVRELCGYPLKSGGGTPLTRAELRAEGFRHDREFMLVRPGGAHLSQRELPRMAALRPAFDGTTLTVDHLDAVTPLKLTARGDGPPRDVTVHGHPCQGVDQGDEAAGWFSALLGRECRLVRFTGRRPTQVGGGTVAYADGYPVLVTAAESLADLNARMDEPLPMNRFRPNIVIEGLGAYGEDAVRLLRLGGAVLELVKPCARCVITTTDQETGAKGHEPLRTLATYRNQDVPGAGPGLIFGQNAVPRTPATIAVGDAVEIIALVGDPA